MKYFIIVLALTSTSCGWKPVARTANDVARDLCSIFFSERNKISLEDAAETACKTRDQLDPWIEQILAAKKAAGAAVAAE